MSKRSATSNLNHDNWDAEEAPEDAGEFSRAPEDVLKSRVVKKAKRRNPIGSYQNDESKPNAFGGFAAFAKTAPQQQKTSAAAPFGFLADLNKSEPPKTNGMSEKSNLDEYYAKLKGLNESVAEWIKKHVSENPLIDLQPIFKDYEKYMQDLEKFKTDISKKSGDQAPVFNFTPTVAVTTSQNTSTNTTSPKFSFGTTGKFTFGSATTTASSFSFGSSAASTVTASSSLSTPSFSFGDSTKFSFGNKPPEKSDEDDNKETEDGEPPKVEFTPVIEQDHVYTIRCKVYVKKDDGFGERGVGNLYLKPVAGKEKVQLIVRADTNLGNLLLNFILSAGIPVKRMGQKDVMLICLPTPESKPPPTTVLLRVKTADDADELFKTLEKHKK